MTARGALQHVRRTRPGARALLTNADVARALREMALRLEMDDVAFKPRAYEKAAYAVEAVSRPLGVIHREGGIAALDEIPSVGRGIAERIGELIETGHIRDLDALRKKCPADVVELTSVEGMGPKSVRALYDSLGVRTVADLERAADQGQLHELPHFGTRKEQKIREAIAVHRGFHGRWLLGSVLGLSELIVARLQRVRGVKRVEVAGSVRRRKETIGDLDVLVASDASERVTDAFVGLPEVVEVVGRGPTKSTVRLANGIHADLRVLGEDSFGAALQYFTGSKAHNLALRRIAQKRGLKLSEYGLFQGERRIAGESEEGVYGALGLPLIPAELREDAGEIEAALAGRLPKLIELGSLRGDLQVHTTWSDGRHGLEAMAKAARELGLEYLAFTDHTRDLAMTGGLDERGLAEQASEVRALDARSRGIRLLAGAEVNIRADGSLDVADSALARLDFVGAAIHSHFDLPRVEMTRRLIRALENPHVDVLMHPLARALGRRPAVDADFDAVIGAARRTGTALEIDAQPERLDLPAELTRKAIDAGVALIISSDAHSTAELRFCNDFGVSVARRGWAEKKDVLNTLPLEKFLARVSKRKRS